EAASEHPLARAIVAGAHARGMEPMGPVEAFAAVPGGGVAARIAGHEVLIGTRRLLRERGIGGGGIAALAGRVEALEGAGRTVMLVAVDGAAAGLLGVADAVKVGSAEAIRRLDERGIEVWMLTGDNRRTAHGVAAEVGIPAERVLAEVLPGDKAAQ